MNEMGRVLKIEGQSVLIKGGELGSCFGCVNEDCRTNGNRFNALNRKSIDLAEGQLVEVGVSTSATIGQAAFVFVPPLALFIAAYAITAAALPDSGEAARAASGVIGLAIGFLAIYLIRKRFPAKAMPEVLRTLSEETVNPEPREGDASDPNALP